jgi:hypothetical protein
MFLGAFCRKKGPGVELGKSEKSKLQQPALDNKSSGHVQVVFLKNILTC